MTTAAVAHSTMFATEVVKEEQKARGIVRNFRGEEEWKRRTAPITERLSGEMRWCVTVSILCFL